MKPKRFIPASLLLLTVACSQTSAPNNTSLSPQAVITVGGSCSLVDAIHAANRDESVGGCPSGSGTDTVQLEADHTYMLSEVDNGASDFGNGLPVITSAIVIEGNGATIERNDEADTPQFRLFEVGSEGDLTLQEVTVRNGEAFSGGGIVNSGRLIIRNSTITENSAYVEGGSVENWGHAVIENSTIADNISVAGHGGGIYMSAGTLILNKSVVRNNSKSGIFAEDSGTLIVTESLIEENGDGISFDSYVDTKTIADSTIRDNREWGVYLEAFAGSVVTNSTISGNSKGGINISVGNMEIVSSTISGNHGYGIYHTVGNVKIELSTITGTLPLDDPDPWSPYGGINHQGGRFVMGHPVHTMTLYHSIVANQQGVPDCVSYIDRPPAPPTSEGFNLDSDGSCGLTQSSDRPRTDPRPGPLQDNGGPTQTHALLPGSPALNAGERTLAVAYDQRGPGFPRVLGSAADIGAYEASARIVTPPEPPANTLCGIPEGLWRLLDHPALYIRFCEVIPEPCFWELCEAPPFLTLLPLEPCLRCGWELALPRETSLRLNFRIDAFAKDPKAFAEAFGFGLYTPEGKLIRQGKLTEVVDPQTKEPRYALGLEANLSKGNYIISVEVLDKKLWDIMGEAPEDYPFEFGLTNK